MHMESATNQNHDCVTSVNAESAGLLSVFAPRQGLVAVVALLFEDNLKRNIPGI